MINPNDVTKGMLVRFTGENASEFEVTLAKNHIKPGETYLISDIFRDKWGVYIYLEGLPDKSFTWKMFEDAGIYQPDTTSPLSHDGVRQVVPPKKKKQAKV